MACTSSSSTITVTPSPTITINAGPNYYYELVMMPLSINAAGCTALGCVTQSGYQQTNFDPTYLTVFNNYNTPNVVAHQIQNLYVYEGPSYLDLQYIYILCTQPKISSLYIAFSVSFTDTYNFPSHYLEITLYDLTISAFPSYAIGAIIPCQLSSNFIAVSGRQAQQCRVVSANVLNSYIRVRI